MKEKKLILLKRLGEDTAYTFKGLYKESDWLELKYKLYLSIPIIFSIVSLGFDQEINPLYLKILAVASLIFTVLVLLGQKRYENIDSYRKVADEVKIIYDKSEKYFVLEEVDQYEELSKEWENLRKKMVTLPVGVIGRKLSKIRIKKEMNLSWLGGEYKANK